MYKKILKNKELTFWPLEGVGNTVTKMVITTIPEVQFA